MNHIQVATGHAHAEDGDDLLMISVRECRLAVERLVQLTYDAPTGVAAPFRDFLLDCVLADNSVFARFDSDLDWLRAAEPGKVDILSNAGGRMVVDALGQSLALAGPAVLDLAVYLASVAPRGHLEVRNLRDAELAGGFAVSAHRYGVAIETVVANDLFVTSTRLPQGGPDLLDPYATGGPLYMKAIREGIAIRRSLWFRVWERSKDALAEDNDVSRRHGGPTMIDAAGKVHGEPLNFD